MSEPWKRPEGTAPAKVGTDPNRHASPAASREIAVDRLRREGVPKDAATHVAERAAREAHDRLNRK